VRFAMPLLVALTVVTLAACGSSETAEPLPVPQRFVNAEDAPGSKPDPVETRQTTTDLGEFMQAARERLVDPDPREMHQLFQDAGFNSAGVDARYFGQQHSFTVPHVFSSFIELESEDGAKDVLDWLEKDSRKPCPESCAVQISDFDSGVEDARGVHRLQTAAGLEKVGNTELKPFDSYWTAFTVGPVVYTAELHRSPGTVSAEQAQKIANAYHDRLAGD
jgi:predicted small lipoprotein YifL